MAESETVRVGNHSHIMDTKHVTTSIPALKTSKWPREEPMRKEEERVLQEFSIDNCRVCIDIKDWSRRAQRLAFSQDKPETSKDTPDSRHAKGQSSTEAKSTAAAVTAVAAAPSLVLSEEAAVECPPDSAALGRATWTFLHTMAAYYPERPSPTQEAQMSTFLHLFSNLYPCGYCAEHLKEEMRHDPPSTGSRGELARWFCRMHNEVNERLGKPVFDCERLDERWRDGPRDGSCD